MYNSAISELLISKYKRTIFKLISILKSVVYCLKKTKKSYGNFKLR